MNLNDEYNKVNHYNFLMDNYIEMILKLVDYSNSLSILPLKLRFGINLFKDYIIKNRYTMLENGINILLENKEKSKLLFEIINELGENQKTAFLLSKVDGLSNPEIAEIMKLSVSSVESLVFRAKSILKEKISNKFKEYRKKKN